MPWPEDYVILKVTKLRINSFVKILLKFLKEPVEVEIALLTADQGS